MNDTSLHEAALEYHRRKLPITLCDGKKPLGKGWQNKRYTDKEIDQEFRARPELNVGLIMGEYVDIEYDAPGGERALLELFDDDAPVCPTWLSTRGKHRLFRSDPSLAEIGKATVNLGPLEIRLGANGKGAQSLLPPSVADGVKREWQVSLDECDPPALPEGVVQRLLRVSRRATTVEEGEERNDTQRTQISHEFSESSEFSVSSVSSVYHPPDTSPSPSIVASVQKAIAATVPTARGLRHRAIFNFARQLKAIPELVNAEADALLNWVQWWHELALPAIGTKAFEETWFDFRNAWVAIKFAAGEEPIAMMYAQALSKPAPKCAEKYQQQQLRGLVALCRELQRHAGDKPFYLACRNAGEQIGVEHNTANRWLKMLCMDRVLQLVKVGVRRQASEFRYLGD